VSKFLRKATSQANQSSLSRTYQYIAAGHNLPTYLAKTSYKEATDINVNNYSEADKDGLDFFGRLQKSPSYFEAFTGRWRHGQRGRPP
jgi:hypothetical protein